MPISRRELLKGIAAAGGLAALGASEAKALGRLLNTQTFDLGNPSNAPIDTIVVLMMENRSWDHYFGWIEGTGTQAKTYYDSAGNPHQTKHWAPDYKGCDYSDPGHGWNAGRVQLGPDRQADGFIKDGSGNDDFALGYYLPEDIPVWTNIAEQATLFPNYFCSVLTSTYPNRWYQHAATSGGRKSNDFAPNPVEGWQEKTIWDACNEAGVSWAYYYCNLPVIGLYGERMMVRNGANIRHISSYHADAALGRLPQVVFVDPFFVAPPGISNDDHPHADIRLGQQFIYEVVDSFVRSPQFGRGALFINYDEWGGFFDTAIPAVVPDDRVAEGFGQRGFRTPAAVVSPFAKPGLAPLVDPSGAPVSYDHTSILKFIEWRYGLPSLTARDAAAANIGQVLDFSSQNAVELDPYVAPPEARIPCEAEGHVAPASDLLPLQEAGVFDKLGMRTDFRFEDSYRSF